jgi:hypothetical protein
MPSEWKWFHVSGYVPNIFYNRQALLDRAKLFRPTHYMWIDSDQVFNFMQLEKLIQHDKPIVSGIYKKSPTLFACCDLEGKTMTTDDVKDKNKLYEIFLNGLETVNINLKPEILNKIKTIMTKNSFDKMLRKTVFIIRDELNINFNVRENPAP